MASLRARHSRACALGGIESRVPESGKVDGCNCHPTYSIRHHSGANKYVTQKLDAPANKQLKKALAALARFEDDAAKGLLDDAERIRFNDHAESWLKTLELDGRSPATIAKYETTVKFVRDYFGDKYLHEIRPKHIEDFRVSLKSVSPTTRNNHMRNLSACFGKAVKLRLIRSNPLEGFERDTETAATGSFFTQEELPKIAEAITLPVYKRLFQAALRTGMRESELIALRWANVREDDSLIQVREGLSNGQAWKPKSKTSNRDVYLDPDTAELFKAWREEEEPAPDDRVFRRPDGLPIRSEECTKALLLPAMRAAKVPREGEDGLKRVFHSLRDTYAATVLAQGKSMYWLSGQLGHSSIRVTEQRYAQLERKVKAAEAASLAGAFAV